MKSIIVIVIAAVAISCNQQQSVKSTASSNPVLDSVRAAIEKVLQEQIDNSLKGIPTDMMAEECAIIAPGKFQIIGKAAADSAGVDYHKSNKVLKFINIIEGLTLQNDIAYQLGYEEGITLSLADNKKSE